MITETTSPRPVPAQPGSLSASDGAYVDWAAILAGAVFALALSFLLISFGAGLGLSLTSPHGDEGISALWLAIASGIWLIWVMVTSFGAGGYLAGRLRRKALDATPDEVEARDGAHGLMVWATGALISTVLVGAGIGGLVGAGMSAAGSAGDAASEAVSSEYFANVMLRSGVVDPDAAAADGDTAPSGQQAAGGTPAVDPAVQQEIAGIVARSVVSGELAPRDRSYLAQLVAANSDLDQDGARNRVDQVTAEIDEVRAQAIEAVDDARIAGVIFGFITAATLLLGAVAAFFAAAAGGRHRDSGLGLDIATERR